MPSIRSLLLLPPSLLAFLTQVAANPQPTALKKLPPDSNEKIFPEHLAFAPVVGFPLEVFDIGLPADRDGGNGDSGVYQRAFAPHIDEPRESVLRRAAEALAMLEKRSSCPSEMTSCEEIGAPNKCCQKGTYCTQVEGSSEAGVACCPNGVVCGGGVGTCPPNAVTCPSSLGGGCCLQGYICQGIGCVTEVISTAPAPTTTSTTTSSEPSVTTVTSTTTTSSRVESTTQTTTQSLSTTATATGGAPWRPTVSSGDTSTSASDTQTGCPTGFYGCLATHGGGCCQTDRDCATRSCPAPSSTTLVSGGVTVVVPASNFPTAAATATCANGWFVCGEEGGPVAGCCPSGYQCGTASCFTVQASQTGSVQKALPDSGASSHGRGAGTSLLGLLGISALAYLL